MPSLEGLEVEVTRDVVLGNWDLGETGDGSSLRASSLVPSSKGLSVDMMRDETLGGWDLGETGGISLLQTSIKGLGIEIVYKVLLNGLDSDGKGDILSLMASPSVEGLREDMMDGALLIDLDVGEMVGGWQYWIHLRSFYRKR